MPDLPSLVERARTLADELLLPAAAAVDATGELPPGHLDALAAAGLYGVLAPPELGGAAQPSDAHRAVEELAGGCLATAFVLVQHLGVVKAVAAATTAYARRELPGLCSGRRRCAVAQSALRPGPPLVRARAVNGGYVFDGEAPWVTGWGLVDLVQVAARDPQDTIVWALLDARAADTLTVQPLDLVAVNASRTVVLRLHEHRVPARRVIGTLPFASWPDRDAAGLRLNGSLALGLAGRCVRLLGDGGTGRPGDGAGSAADLLSVQLDGARDELDLAGPPGLPAARATASALALRAAATYAAAAGASGVLVGEHAQRFIREAVFLLVFGSRPAIRSELLRELSSGAGHRV